MLGVARCLIYYMAVVMCNPETMATSREMATPHNDHRHRLGMLHDSTYYYAVLKKYQSRRRVNLAHQDRTETPAWPRRYLQQPLGTCKLAKHKAGRKKGGQEKTLLGKCRENIGGKTVVNQIPRALSVINLSPHLPWLLSSCTLHSTDYT